MQSYERELNKNRRGSASNADDKGWRQQRRDSRKSIKKNSSKNLNKYEENT